MEKRQQDNNQGTYGTFQKEEHGSQYTLVDDNGAISNDADAEQNVDRKDQQQKPFLSHICFSKSSIFLLVVVIIYVAMGVLSTIFYKKELNALYGYPFILSQANYMITFFAFLISEIMLQVSMKYIGSRQKTGGEFHHSASVNLNTPQNMSLAPGLSEPPVSSEPPKSLEPPTSSQQLLIGNTPISNQSFIIGTVSNDDVGIEQKDLFVHSSLKKDISKFSYAWNEHILPKVHFFLIAILDVVATLLQIVGANGMGKQSGPLMVIISQSSIPLTVIFTVLLLKEKYSKLELFGSMIVFLGVLATIIPDISLLLFPTRNLYITEPAYNLEKDQAYGDYRSPQDPIRFFYTFLFLLSFIPNTLMKIYEQYIFSKYKAISAFKVGLWERIFEIPLGILLGPIYMLLNGDIQFENIQGAMKHQVIDGTKCLIGLEVAINSTQADYLLYRTTNPTNYSGNIPPRQGIIGNHDSTKCDFAWITVIIFNIFSFLWLASGLAVTKYSNANLNFFSNAVALAICPFLFSLPWVMGQDASKLSIYQIVGFIILLLGTIAYGIGKEKKRISNEKEKHSIF